MNDTDEPQRPAAPPLIVTARSPVMFAAVPASLTLALTAACLERITHAMRASASLAARGIPLQGLDVIAPTQPSAVALRTAQDQARGWRLTHPSQLHTSRAAR